MISSGAALAGSPLSGGYAGAKATQRFITAYAQGEANRAGLGSMAGSRRTGAVKEFERQSAASLQAEPLAA